jgi:hypothetical protein
MIFRAITKATAIILAAACLIVGVAAAAFDWGEVRPRLAEIRATLETFAPEDRNVPPNVADLIWKLDDKQEVHVNAQVASTLVSTSLPMKAGAWHVRNFLWSLLLPLHFDRQSRTALYCHDLLYEDGRGLSNAAEYYFHKQPHELTSEQVAGILAIARSPNMNSPTRHPDRYAQNTARLLNVYATP